MVSWVLLLRRGLHVELWTVDTGISDGFVDLKSIFIWRIFPLLVLLLLRCLHFFNWISGCLSVPVAGRYLLLLLGHLFSLLLLLFSPLDLALDPVYPSLEHRLLLFIDFELEVLLVHLRRP